MFPIIKNLVLGGMLLTGAAGTSIAQTAATFPNKPIHIIVPFGAGTTTDQAARYISQRITEQTSQPVVVENKAGANGFIALQHLLQQPADGYTIVIGTNTTHAANKALFKKLPYEPVADFIPLTGVTQGGLVLTVSPEMPVSNVQELIALLKKNPGKYSFGSGNSSSRGGAEIFKDQAGVDIFHVPYKTLPTAIADVLGGRLDMVFGDAPAVMPNVRAGKLKALGVTTRTRMPGYEEIPTIAEQGLPNYEASGWLAAFAPKGTPSAVVEKLSKMIGDIMRTPDAEKFFGVNAWKPIPGTSAELAAFQKSEIEKWQRLVDKAGIQPE